MADKFKACSVSDCNGNAHSSAYGGKGYCCAHYTRLKRHGDPLEGGTSHGQPMSFYTDVVLIYEDDECLIWPFAHIPKGYGVMYMDGKLALVSRLVCEYVNGPSPTPKHQAAHSCGKGHLGCVTKRHLSWKTRKENEEDKLDHGTRIRGERHSSAKLTEDDVREIHSLKGIVPQLTIATRFNVSPSNISLIQSGKIWSWLIFAP